MAGFPPHKGIGKSAPQSRELGPSLSVEAERNHQLLLGSDHDLEAELDISNHNDPIVAIVGVGFVGETLLREFSKAFECIAYDISLGRIAALRASFAGSAVHAIEFTADAKSLNRANHFLISVPTLLHSDRRVNLDFVKNAINTVLVNAKPGSTIVVESSVSVGTTRHLLGPFSRTHHIGMSPERVDPGRVSPAAHEIPKIVSGLTPIALSRIENIYNAVFKQVVPVTSVETAEMTKLFENCFRMVNIAYVNEMADFALRHGIDPAEVVNAAASKPYGFMKFSPGLGVGGHCIPVNPYYLFDSDKSAGQDKKDGEEGSLAPKTTRIAAMFPVLERATRSTWDRPKRMARRFHRRALLMSKSKSRTSDPTSAPASASASASASTSASGFSAASRSASTTLSGHSKGLTITGGGAVVRSTSHQGKNRNNKPRKPRILVVGIGFKPGQSVLSCSPGLAFAETLRELGTERLAFYDPLVAQKDVVWMDKLEDVDWTATYIDREFDAVAVCGAQSGIDFEVLDSLRGHRRSRGRGRGIGRGRTYIRSWVYM